MLIPLLILLFCVWVCHWAWARPGDGRAARWVAGTVLVMGLGDGLLLAALPLLGLSFGPVGLPWLTMILIRTGLALAVAVFTRRYLHGQLTGAVVLLGVFNVAILASEVYGLYFEPFNLGVSRLQVVLPASASFRVRVVQLSDLHVERTTERERRMLATVERLKPDLLLLTGDYLNLDYVDDARARRDTRELLRQLYAPYGVYAIPGTPVVDTDDALAALFDGLDNVTLLYDEFVQLDLDGQTVYLVGVANLELERDRDSLRELMAQLPPEALSVLLYHTPDLIETAAELGVDLYLAGHTHGGQVRLPWFGAIFTGSRYGKRYEAGLYQVGSTRLYVSRGIGLEGLGMPRVRFLCPPEIVDLALTGPSR